MEIAYTIFAVVAFSALLTFISMRKRAASWSGVVTDIGRYSVSGPNEVDRDEYAIRYRTDSGSNGRLEVNEWAYRQLYSDLAVGDRLVKEPGEYTPKKA